VSVTFWYGSGSGGPYLGLTDSDTQPEQDPDPDPYQNVTDPEHCANLGSASKNLCTLTPKIVSKL